MINFFPTISSYNFGLTGGVKTVKNIFTSVNVDIDDVELVKEEIAYPAERPEQASYRLYNDFNNYWAILLLNGIKNPFNWNTVLGQDLNNESLERYDTRVLQFGNLSPFLPSVSENGITIDGMIRDFYEPDDIDSYLGVKFGDINIGVGDTLLFETGGGVDRIKCVGAGILPSPSIGMDLNTAGRIQDWYQHGQCIVPSTSNFLQTKLQQITAGKKLTCALDANGIIHCWGDEALIVKFTEFSNEIPFSIDTPNYCISNISSVKFIEASEDKLVAIDSSNTIRIVNGSDERSLIGSGVTGSKVSFFHITDDGSEGGVALLSNGTVVDFNSFPPTGTTLSDVACGSQFCIGLLGNGSLTGWGSNDYNQLGGIPGGTGFTKISATYNHALALKNDGTVYAWGLSADGQCTVPDKKFIDISAGKKHSAALTQNNELCAWGKITKSGFAGTNTTGLIGTTYSDYTMNEYSIYGKFDKIYSGDNHIVLAGLTGEYKRFYGIITNIDFDYMRITCKIFGGDLGTDELFFDDPTGTIVTVIDTDTKEIKGTIHHKLLGIQKQKNATLEIKSGNQIIPLTSEIWKTVYIINYNTPDKDIRLITLKKIYDSYNLTLKNKFYYVSPILIQKLQAKIQKDINQNNLNLNYKLSTI